jgi:hypothetical protein
MDSRRSHEDYYTIMTPELGNLVAARQVPPSRIGRSLPSVEREGTEDSPYHPQQSIGAVTLHDTTL